MIHVRITTGTRAAKIEEAKKTSVAYKEWQRALNIRKAVIAQAGNDCKAYERAQKLIKDWHAAWEWECNQIDADIDQDILDELDAAEEAHRNHFPSVSN